jgi:hypothetical protein
MQRTVIGFCAVLLIATASPHPGAAGDKDAAAAAPRIDACSEHYGCLEHGVLSQKAECVCRAHPEHLELLALAAPAAKPSATHDRIEPEPRMAAARRR